MSDLIYTIEADVDLTSSTYAKSNTVPLTVTRGKKLVFDLQAGNVYEIWSTDGNVERWVLPKYVLLQNTGANDIIITGQDTGAVNVFQLELPVGQITVLPSTEFDVNGSGFVAIEKMFAETVSGAGKIELIIAE